jgi:hypothetical protein
MIDPEAIAQYLLNHSDKFDGTEGGLVPQMQITNAAGLFAIAAAILAVSRSIDGLEMTLRSKADK